MRVFFLFPFLMAASSSQTLATDVDAAIVFAVDASASIDWRTAKRQREGHIAALTEPRVIAAIAAGLNGCIAIAYMEWASAEKLRLILPWTRICSRSDALAAAKIIQARGEVGAACQGLCATSISYAIDASSALLDAYGGNARNKIIDISANGTNNDGPPLQVSRSNALKRGHIINGIVIPQVRYGFPYRLIGYFNDNVIGGAGSFAIEPNTVEDYAQALRKKFEREISMLVEAPSGQ